MPSRYSNVIKVQIFYSIGAQYTKGLFSYQLRVFVDLIVDI